MRQSSQQSSIRSSYGVHRISLRNPADRVSAVFNLNSRRGFTLAEMLLVLGVIAVFMSMTIPPVLRIFHQEKLTKAAETIRAAIARARISAIESGLIYQFCCEANGANFVVAPFEPDHLNMNSTNSNGVNSTFGRHAGQLPKGITLSLGIGGTSGLTTATVTATNAYKLSTLALDGLPNSGDLANLNWAPPILFNPNGSANFDTVVTVHDTRAQQVRLQVRAFTGGVSIGRIFTEKR